LYEIPGGDRGGDDRDGRPRCRRSVRIVDPEFVRLGHRNRDIQALGDRSGHRGTAPPGDDRGGYKIGSLQALADQLASLQQIQVQVTDQDGVILTRTGGISGHLTPAPVTTDLTAALGGRSGTAARSRTDWGSSAGNASPSSQSMSTV
jgi:hypothetical protein